MRILCSLSLLLSLQALAQRPPRRTECLQWDHAYAQTVTFGVFAAALLALVLGLTVGLLFGRQFWWAASPRKRIWTAGTAAFALIGFVIVAWPRILPLGKLLYASVSPRYRDCQAMAFGAPGLFGGMLGEGVAAYAQWQLIILLLAGAAALGTLVAWVLSEAMVRNRGLEAMARGGEA